MSGRTWSLASPRVVFPALALALALAALLRPTDQREDSRLSTHSAAPNGAKALFDVAGRLGWRPVRRDSTPLVQALDATSVTYVVLAPVRAVSPADAHALLDRVRAGAGLLLALSDDESLTGSLADSLKLSVIGFGFHALDGGSADSAIGGGARDAARGCRTANGAGTEFVRRVFAEPTTPRDGTRMLLGARFGARSGARALPAALARPFGLGRVVAVADPDLLRNDVLRLCGGEESPQRPGVRAVRFLEAVAPTGGALVFDEWHQGYGRQPERVGAVTYALGRTGWGRAVGVAALAALLWLWSAGARVLVPVERQSVERRSPLEHVGALARAYEQVGASRTAVHRMVRGLRRRHPSAARRGSDDASFLNALADRQPELTGDVTLVRDGAVRQLDPAELALVGDAVERIDAALGNPAGSRSRAVRGSA